MKYYQQNVNFIVHNNLKHVLRSGDKLTPGCFRAGWILTHGYRLSADST